MKGLGKTYQQIEDSTQESFNFGQAARTVRLMCEGRAIHDQLSARQVAFVKSRNGRRFLAKGCELCKGWHVESTEVKK